MAKLTWGRRALMESDPSSRRRSVLVAILVVVGLVSSGDQLRQPSIIDRHSMAQIQSLLDQHLRTLERQDVFQYERTLDRRSPAFTRCMREYFELGKLRVEAFGRNRLLTIEQVSPSMVRGYVEHRDGIGIHYFRHVLTTTIITRPPFDIRYSFVTWYLTRPEPDEVGELRTQTADGITLRYRAIDERFSEGFLREAAIARAAAVQRAPEPPSDPAPPLKVYLAPRSEPPDSCFLAGHYSAATDLVLIYGFQVDSTRTGPSAGSARTLGHELLHWLQWRHVGNFSEVPWWLREGWPDHIVGSSGVSGFMEGRLCGADAAPPSALELERGPTPLTTGERFVFLYHVARSLVDHLYRSGLDDAGYWRLVRALSDEATAETAFESQVGASFESVRANWLERIQAAEC